MDTPSGTGKSFLVSRTLTFVSSALLSSAAADAESPIPSSNSLTPMMSLIFPFCVVQHAASCPPFANWCILPRMLTLRRLVTRCPLSLITLLSVWIMKTSCLNIACCKIVHLLHSHRSRGWLCFSPAASLRDGRGTWAFATGLAMAFAKGFCNASAWHGLHHHHPSGSTRPSYARGVAKISRPHL